MCSLTLFAIIYVPLYNSHRRGQVKKASKRAPNASVIGSIAKSLANDVFQVAQAGAKDAASELGEKYNVDVEVENRTPNEEDATKQAEAIEALTSRGVDGIAISCSEVNAVTPSIDKAVSKGVAVMFRFRCAR